MRKREIVKATETLSIHGGGEFAEEKGVGFIFYPTHTKQDKNLVKEKHWAKVHKLQ